MAFGQRDQVSKFFAKFFARPNLAKFFARAQVWPNFCALGQATANFSCKSWMCLLFTSIISALHRKRRPHIDSPRSPIDQSLLHVNVDHILILHARQSTKVSSTFVHFSSNRFQPNQSIQLRITHHHPTTTMSSEEKKKSGMSSKSPEANKLRAELAKGLHGDIREEE